MLALDRTIGCIEASESEVLDLYRSVPVTMSSAAGAKPASMEAYVCAIKEKPGVKVYLALVADNRRIYVYTEPGKFDSEEGFKDSVQEALAFARSLGFSPEPVALSYSPAMREVVVRNMKILRPPGSRVRAVLKHGSAYAPTLTSVKGAQKRAGAAPATGRAAVTLAPAAAASAPPARLAAVPPPVPATPAAAIPPVPATPVITPAAKPIAEEVAAYVTAQVAAAKPKPSAPHSISDVNRELNTVQAISDLKKGLKSVAAEKDEQSAQLQQLSELHQIALAELAGAREESARLVAERDRLVRDKERLEALAGDRKALLAERDAAQEQLQELTALHQAATEELTVAREGCVRLSAEKEKLAARGKKQLEALTAERDDAKEQLQELTALNQATTAELAGAREECARLGAERDGLATQDQKQLQKIGAERDAAREQLRKLTALYQEATAELAGAREECARLGAERDDWAAAQSQLKEVAGERDAAEERLRALTALHQATTAELAAVRQECARLSAKRDELVLGRKELEGVATERDALAQQLRELSAQHQGATAELQRLREECARLTEEREALKRSAVTAGQASSKLNSLQTEIAALATQLHEAVLCNLEIGAVGKVGAMVAAPVDAVAKATPRQEPVSPCDTEETVPPAVEVAKQQPAVLEPTQRPVVVEAKQPPAIVEAKQPPVVAEAKQRPVVAEAKQPPVVVEAKQRPAMIEAEPEPLQSAAPALPDQAETLPVLSRPEKDAKKAKEEDKDKDDEATQPAAAPLTEEPSSAPVLMETVEAQASYEVEAAYEAVTYEAEASHEAQATYQVESAAEEAVPAPEPQAAVPDAVPAAANTEDGRELSSAAHPEFGSNQQFHDFTSDEPLDRFSAAAHPEHFSSTAQHAEYAISEPVIPATEFTPLGELHDFFSAADEEPSSARFLLRSDLTAIECLSLDEVVELHQSINNANISPDGKGQETCRGYICGLRKGKSVQVFAAIFGTQSGRTRVYAPEVQPEDDQSYSRTVKGAINFAEEVGLMMEQVKLGASPVMQRDSLMRCPVLRSAGKDSSEGATKH